MTSSRPIQIIDVPLNPGASQLGTHAGLSDIQHMLLDLRLRGRETINYS